MLPRLRFIDRILKDVECNSYSSLKKKVEKRQGWRSVAHEYSDWSPRRNVLNNYDYSETVIEKVMIYERYVGQGPASN